MNWLVSLFGLVLKVFYDLFDNYGVAIILFSVFAKVITLPFQMKSKKSMLDMQRIQPKLKELERKYKDDKQRYSLEVQKLYKKENVSMLGGCLPMLIMFPVMIILYNVIREPLTYMLGITWDQLYGIAHNLGIDITNPNYMIQQELTQAISRGDAGIVGTALEGISFKFFGIDLSAIPNLNASVDALMSGEWVTYIIPVLSGVTSFLSSWFMRKSQGGNMNEQAAQTNGIMNWIMPLMSLWIAFMVPAGLGLYWIMTNILSAAQEPLLNLYYKNKAKKAAEAEEASGVYNGGNKNNGKKH